MTIKQVNTTWKRTEQRSIGGTFIVEVCCRENASWQGKVTWADKGRSQYFRSALELLKLMDQALDEGEEKKDIDE